MVDTTTRCAACGRAGLAVSRQQHDVTAEDGTVLQFEDEAYRCEHCGETRFTPEQSLASSRARAGVLRTYEHLLPPDRIKSIRESYGLTQADFERALRLGPKTVVRWESGTVRQSAIANSLLLAIDGNRTAFAKVAEANGVDVGVPAPPSSAEPVIVYGSSLAQLSTAESIIAYGGTVPSMFSDTTFTYTVANTTADTGSSPRRYDKFRKIKPARPKRVKVA
jgi:HTH-type transcriptional regulator / antitoxin MqsA